MPGFGIHRRASVLGLQVRVAEGLLRVSGRSSFEQPWQILSNFIYALVQSLLYASSWLTYR